MLIVYYSEPIGEANGGGFYSVDESLFNHINDSQVWCLGIINYESKVFGIEAALNRSEETLKKFIFKFVPSGNTIISDGWAGYRLLDLDNSGYHHVITNHTFGNFGYGIQSSSHIEAIWNILKSKIKSTYYVIPQKNMLHFIREAEFKLNITGKTRAEKIKEFFDSFKCINDLNDANIPDTEFFRDDSNEED